MEGSEHEGARSNDGVGETKGRKNEVCIDSNSNERCSAAFFTQTLVGAIKHRQYPAFLPLNVIHPIIISAPQQSFKARSQLLPV